MKRYNISTMSENEVQAAINLAEKEGWEPGLNDAQLFYQADSHGFFKGEVDNHIVATGSAVIYDDDFAFFGLYIVDEAYRGQGLGLELSKHAHDYCGNRNIGLDGVLEQVEIYERIGYKPFHMNARYLLNQDIKAEHSHHLVSLDEISFDALSDFDRQHFPANRERFLRAWCEQPKALALGYVEDGHLRGYGVIRPCQKSFKIGPLFAENIDIARTLFLNLAHFAEGKPVYLDIPESNELAFELIDEFNMDKVFATQRMYTKKCPEIKVEQIFGITSFELG